MNRLVSSSDRTRCRWVLLLLVLLLATLATACSGGDDDEVAGSIEEATAPPAAPDWIMKIYPPPGAETTATQAVQVRHRPIDVGEEIRLVIDGTDVTAYARSGPGLLEYDIDQASSPVSLKPGMHEATVELYNVQPGASEGADSYSAEQRELLTTFTWEFEVL